jgi:hypothetical protein
MMSNNWALFEALLPRTYPAFALKSNCYRVLIAKITARVALFFATSDVIKHKKFTE